MTEPILPTPGKIVGAAKKRLRIVRPTAATGAESGRYAQILDGWRAQFALARRRLAGEVAAARLPFAAGRELTELVRSEYDIERSEAPTTAVGEVLLSRSVVHVYAGITPTAAAATDANTTIAALEELCDVLNGHLLSAHDPAIGTGAHAAADPSASLVMVDSTKMGDLCSLANDMRAASWLHFANAPVIDSDQLASIHKDADGVTVLDVGDAVASDPADPFDANTLESRTTLMLVVNALQAAWRGHVQLQAKGGTIRAGADFQLEAAPAAIPAIAGGNYKATADRYVPAGSRQIDVPVQAVLGGAIGNVPQWSTGGPSLTLKATTPLFDAGQTLRFAPIDLLAAGGSAGQQDGLVRRAAKATWIARAGPTLGALEATTLIAQGLNNVLLLEDTTTGTAWVYAADPSWCWSAAFGERVVQTVRPGAGCRVRVGEIRNRVTRIEATIALRTAADLGQTTSLSDTIRTRLRARFDDPLTWFAWSEDELRSLVSASSRLILACSSLRVLDVEGRPIGDPSSPAPPEPAIHWVLADNAVDLEFTPPQ